MAQAASGVLLARAGHVAEVCITLTSGLFYV